MSDAGDGVSDRNAEPLLIKRIDRLSINDKQGWFRCVRIAFASAQLLARGQHVRIDYGFDERGDPRELLGVPTHVRTLTKKFDLVLHLYRLEVQVPSPDP